MNADRPTLRALLWYFAAASPKAPTIGAVLDKDWAIVQGSTGAVEHMDVRERPLPAHCALLQNTTETLNPNLSP